jgi:hypothetical protein
MPNIHISNAILLPSIDSGLQHSIVRLHNRHIDGKQNNRSLFKRREAVVIINHDNDSQIVRYVMGANHLTGLTLNSCAIDYDAMVNLGIRGDQPVDLQIKRASTLDIWRWFWNYQDLGIQLSFKLGMLGAVLGIFSFFTDVILAILT